MTARRAVVGAPPARIYVQVCPECGETYLSDPDPEALGGITCLLCDSEPKYELVAYVLPAPADGSEEGRDV